MTETTIKDFNEFIDLALRTESRPEKLGVNAGLFATALHGVVQLTDALDLIKKTAFYGKELNVEAVRKLLGDAASIIGFVAAEADNLAVAEADIVSIRRVEQTEGGAETESHISLASDSFPVRPTHSILGVLTESGELVRALLDSVLSGKPLDAVNIGEEFGDIDWYKAIGFDALGLSEPATREAVIAKLRKRYPEKFDAVAAENRNLEAERAALEEHIA